jgi:hypothetical protein
VLEAASPGGATGWAEAAAAGLMDTAGATLATCTRSEHSKRALRAGFCSVPVSSMINRLQ